MDKGEQLGIDEVENEYKEAKKELQQKVEDKSFLYSIIDDMETTPQVKQLLKDNAELKLIL